MMSIHRTSGGMALAALLAAAIVLLIAFKACDHSRRLGFVPRALRVSKVLYAAEQSSGIGSGGNESGAIVYRLSDEVAEKIKQNGLQYFSIAFGGSQSSDDQTRRYTEWAETPLLSDPSWRETPVDKIETPNPRVENYLNRYGVGAALEPNVAQEIDAIVSQPGAYFAIGRTGILIVAPAAKKVIYVYSG